MTRSTGSLSENSSPSRAASAREDPVAVRRNSAAQRGQDARLVVDAAAGSQRSCSWRRAASRHRSEQIRHRMAFGLPRALAQPAAGRGTSCPGPVRCHLDAAVVLLDDAVGQRQAQAGALAHRLGGEEGVEDAVEVLRRDALAGVGDLRPRLRSPLAAGAQGDGAALPSMAWAALTSRFMNTWLSCEGRHSISGSSPYSLTTSALYLSSFQTTLSVLSRPWCRSAHCHSARSTWEKSFRS